MADPSGNKKCQVSKYLTPDASFDRHDFANFDQYKEAVGYPIADGFTVHDRCFYETIRASIPRPYWAAWRDAHMDWSPRADKGFACTMCAPELGDAHMDC